jgi:hypothetical protein
VWHSRHHDGIQANPDEWKGGIPGHREQKFRYTDFTFKTIVDSTMKRAIALAESTGGKREGGMLKIAAQKPEATRLEMWNDFGKPVERVAHDDGAVALEGRLEDGQARPYGRK